MAAQLVGLFLSDAADVTDSEVDLVLPELCARMNPELNDFFGSAPQVRRDGRPVTPGAGFGRGILCFLAISLAIIQRAVYWLIWMERLS